MRSADEEDGLATPTNDARALHELLEVVGSGDNSPTEAWAAVLDAPYGSLEYARRHAEAVALYSGTLAHLASLPDRSRERFEKYAWSWWMGITAPMHAWGTRVDMKGVVDPAALDQLGSVADLIESRLAGSLAVTTPDADLRDLRSVSQEWIDTLLKDSDLAQPLRLHLLQDLHHIMWLIDHVELFGVARVAAVGQQVVGNLAVAGDTIPDANRGEWLARGKKLVAAIVLLGGIQSGVHSTMMLTHEAGHFIAELTSGSSTGAPTAPGPVDSGTTGLEPGQGA